MDCGSFPPQACRFKTSLALLDHIHAAWGTAPVSKIKREMKRYVEAGYTAFGGSSPVVIVVIFASHPRFLPDMVR